MPVPPAVRALVRSTPSIAPVPHRAILSLTGSQASEFLNGQLASSVSVPPRPRFSAFLHAQGRVMYDVFIYTRTDPTGKPSYLIEYDARESEAPPLLPMLKRYVLRSKVKIRDVTEEYDVWSAWGSEQSDSHAPEPKKKWSWAPSGAVEPVWDASEEWPWGHEDLALNDARAPGMGRRQLVTKGELPKERSSHDIVTSADYTLHRVLHGVPEGVVDIPPMHALPMDSNLDVMGGLDFRKGCYVGQELTVRTYHTGMVRKRVLPVCIQDLRSETETSALASSIPANLDIKSAIAQTSNPSKPTPRPRGTGKLLTSSHGVGLALLRLEHVEGVQRGLLRFTAEAGTEEGARSWRIWPWWPSWWPTKSADTTEA
ncbi:Aminomethyltransferase folate-binding domain-containing protein [Punctularia strigosozonata HHB-11173 SS5]|uniref:Aminomethyltransferase folate-binding domain-containing protein n=1 Tax=Punctularia strigosozonata (strain HHB-11173) TaxID=741275 RepID=UPI0004416F5B|nr:Aminomethyltransferase folate-binding domain-containing protein [Punctularia strigosozonata HHB-11173 SS5]EIN10687.1 Aminomethyltransferase folate-binding domain-containing protein [Punctularia strigosozonata HHB-11173 SS5]